jgi:hypothetical protein
MAGDLIRWTRSNKELGLLSPELAKIEKVSDHEIVLRHAKITKNGIEADNDLTTINPKDQAYQHWDHAYAITSYSSQAKTIDEAIINAESYHKFLTSQRTMLVAMTRAVNKLTIYTDNKSKLIEQLEVNPGDKTSALETVGELGSYAENSSTTQQASQVEKEYKSAHYATIEPRKGKFIDANQVINHLNDNAQVIVTKILGEPKSRERDDFRYSYSEAFGGEDGKRDGGSLYVAVSGSKQGSWHCFKNGMGGRNLLSLIQHRYNLDFKQSLEYAVDLLGMSKEQFQTIELPKHIHMPNSADTSAKLSSKYLPENWDEKQQKSVKHARKLVRESVSIKGTIAEKYLREHRGISAKLPKSFRFHPDVYSGINSASRPALLVVGENKDGKVQSVQAIFLDEATANKAENLKLKKQTWGVAAGAPATIGDKNERDNGTKNFTFVAEGPETAMSILESFPDSQVKITFGKSSFRHVYLTDVAKNIVLCLDNDVDNPSTEMLTKTAAETLEKVGKKVWIAKPEEAGKDYNDLIKEQGTDAIRRNIEQAIPYEFYAKDKPANTNLNKEILRPEQQKNQTFAKEIDRKIEEAARESTHITKEQEQAIDAIFADDKLKSIEYHTNFGDIFEDSLNHRSTDISSKDIRNTVDSHIQQAAKEQAKIDREIQKLADKEKDFEREI